MKKYVLLATKFCQGEYENNVDCETWQVVFRYLIQNLNQMEFDKHKIHTLCTVNGGNLRRKIKNDELVLNVLTNSLPGYGGNGIVLYRGECQFLYRENKIGFCWTPKIEVVEKFASGLNAIEYGGVLLKAYAPPTAILASPNDHSVNQMKEFEYTCNPKLLECVEVVRCFDNRGESI